MTPKFRLNDLPIPDDIVAGGAGWSKSMDDMAIHIGAYRTLLLSEYYGGREMYIPSDYLRNPFIPIIGMEAGKKLSFVYSRERIIIPLGKNALARARRAPILSAVRANLLSVGDGAQLVGMRRDNFSRCLRQTSEGIGVEPIKLPIVKNSEMLRDAAGIAVAALERAGADANVIQVACDEIIRLGEFDEIATSVSDRSEVRILLTQALEARQCADANGGSLIEAYKLMSLAAAAGSLEANSHLLDMGEEMSPWQRSIARGNARWTIGFSRVGGGCLDGLVQLPIREALRASHVHLYGADADTSHDFQSEATNQKEEDA